MCGSGDSVADLVGSTPGTQRQAHHLPGEIRCQHKKPGDEVTTANLGAQGAEKITIAITAEFTKHILTNKVDWNRHQDETGKQQTEK